MNFLYFTILSTGFYREIELGSYFVKRPEDAIWPVVRSSSVEELADLCVRELLEGIHGTDVQAGVIKLGTSRGPMTEAEVKTFRAGARAQQKTGVHITSLTAEEEEQMMLINPQRIIPIQ